MPAGIGHRPCTGAEARSTSAPPTGAATARRSPAQAVPESPANHMFDVRNAHSPVQHCMQSDMRALLGVSIFIEAAVGMMQNSHAASRMIELVPLAEAQLARCVSASPR